MALKGLMKFAYFSISWRILPDLMSGISFSLIFVSVLDISVIVRGTCGFGFSVLIRLSVFVFVTFFRVF